VSLPPKLGILLGVTLVAVAADQLSKLGVALGVLEGSRVAVIEGFLYLTHVRNPGAAFGLLAGWPASMRLAGFVGVSLVAVVVVMMLYRGLAPGERLKTCGLALVLGGTIGNVIDRVWRGEVVDFLHFDLWGGFAWPDFNLADLFIVCGVAILVLELLVAEASARADAAAPPEEPRGS